mmetsp:Transcript_50928/g.100099  ORF Transcript_50928/g.100099 Transcript_50928/m.100099 type:complete len:143 (-) Transcript_50928:100-528(-)
MRDGSLSCVSSLLFLPCVFFQIAWGRHREATHQHPDRKNLTDPTPSIQPREKPKRRSLRYMHECQDKKKRRGEKQAAKQTTRRTTRTFLLPHSPSHVQSSSSRRQFQSTHPPALAPIHLNGSDDAHDQNSPRRTKTDDRTGR